MLLPAVEVFIFRIYVLWAAISVGTQISLCHHFLLSVSDSLDSTSALLPGEAQFLSQL